MCNGAEQSPINIRPLTAKKGVKVELTLNWPNTTGFFFNHTDNFFMLEGKGFKNATTVFESSTYQLERVMFHRPAEHSIDSEMFPMELQFMHKAAKHPDGTIGPLIVSVLYQTSDAGKVKGMWNSQQAKSDFDSENVGNPVLAKDLNFKNLPKKGRTANILGRCNQDGPEAKKPSPEVVGCKFFDPKQLLAEGAAPGSLDYYQYRGSLTYPPCTENVQWLVLKNHPKLTYEQLEQLPIDRNYRPFSLNKNQGNVQLNSGHKAKEVKAAVPNSRVKDCGLYGQNCGGGVLLQNVHVILPATVSASAYKTVGTQSIWTALYL